MPPGESRTRPMNYVSPTRSWPVEPYKGLSFYSPEDVPLFAGREDDVQRVATQLAKYSSRVLIMHGYTGCGKSSFLRAGLIPYLETHADFEFLKDATNRLRAFFIRSTDKPLIELAKNVLAFVKQDVIVHTPNGDRSLGLTTIVRDAEEADFIERVGRNPSELMQILSQIARKATRTLVLIVDQAEEIITLKPDQEGEKFRQEFFSFLALMTNTRIELKLLVALRSEYFAQFDDEMNHQEINWSAVERVRLKELDSPQIIKAIKRPTLKESIDDYGVPYEHYKFEFEAGLPERIAHDLYSRSLAGGRLPVLQVVCERLYSKTKPLDPTVSWVIKRSDFETLGGIEQQMEENLNVELFRLCDQHGITSVRSRDVEIERWKRVLATLAKSQPDGTVTTELKSRKDLENEARNAKCVANFDETMKYLTTDGVRILRREDLVKLGTGELVECYSLGHDAIGLVLNQWSIADKYQISRQNRIRLIYLVFGVIFCLIGIIVGTFVYFSPQPGKVIKDIALMAFIYGLAGLVLSAFPRFFELLIELNVLLAYPFLARSRKEQFQQSKAFRRIISSYPGLWETVLRCSNFFERTVEKLFSPWS